MLIFGSPGRYIQGPGTISEIGAAIAQAGRSAAVVADDFVAGIIGEPIAESAAAHGIAVRFLAQNGEVTASAIAALRASYDTDPAEVVVAAGGGKSIDTGKALAHAYGLPLITVPTVASNDSPTSKNYVIYDDNHQLLEVGHLPASPRHVIVDTSLIARAPRQFLLAGIGDAITKRFEAEQCLASGGRNMFGAKSSLAGVALARACYDILRADAPAALERCGTGEPDAAFERLIEAVLLLSGLGFESGGLSIAHAMTRGLSRTAGAGKSLHGFQVAYATLVQLVLEGRDDAFMSDLLDFYRHIGLPVCLGDIGESQITEELLANIAGPTLAAPHAANFERRLTIGDMVAAMRTLETFTRSA